MYYSQSYSTSRITGTGYHGMYYKNGSGNFILDPGSKKDITDLPPKNLTRRVPFGSMVDGTTYRFAVVFKDSQGVSYDTVKEFVFKSRSGDPTPPPVNNGGGLVPCGDNCGFTDLMTLIQKVISFILFALAVPIAAIMFAYAGFLLITSGGEASQKTKAKKIFTNVAIGFIIAVAAWLIVKLVLSLLGYEPPSWTGF
jgi:hypothetical protein